MRVKMKLAGQWFLGTLMGKQGKLVTVLWDNGELETFDPEDYEMYEYGEAG